MNITITQAHLARAHNAVGQAPEAVADLVKSEATAAIGVFPTNLVEEPGGPTTCPARSAMTPRSRMSPSSDSRARRRRFK